MALRAPWLMRLAVPLIVMPFLEVTLLVWLATRISLLLTIAIVVSTGLVGAALARHQGLKAWTAIRSDLAHRKLPAQSMVDGLLVLAAGMMLMTPGLITDAFGFLLLVPPLRHWAGLYVLQSLRQRVEMRVRGFQSAKRGGEIIDAEYRRVDVPAIDHTPADSTTNRR